MKFRAVISNEGILGVRYVVRTIWFTANERNTHTHILLCVWQTQRLEKAKVNKLFFFAKNGLLDKEDYKPDPLMVTINHLIIQANS